MKKYFYLTGALSAVIYIFAVVYGGALWSGYSHLHQSISELTMATSPVLHRVEWIFTLYNLLLLVFGVMLVNFARKKENKLFTLSGFFLILCAVASIGMHWAPQDPIGQTLTRAGLWHLILAGIDSLSTMLAMLFTAIAFKKIGNRKMAKFSWITLIAVFISGMGTAAAPNFLPASFGLIERITIGTFIVWLFVVSTVASDASIS